MTMWLIMADGTERDVDGRMTLEGLQCLVGGHVQHVRLADGRHLFLDEDARAKHKAQNPKATRLFASAMSVVVGDVLVLTHDEYEAMQPNVRWFRKPT